MSQSQGIEVRRPSRRTIASGAAWAVPVIAVGAAAPAMAASPPPCVPSFETTEGSFKCCNAGPVKNMKVVILVTDTNGCLEEGDDTICIQSVQATNGGSIQSVVFEGDQCVTVGGTVTAYLLGVSNCGVNLTVTYTLNGGTSKVAYLKSDNIAQGNTTGDCQP